jgi:hypothetical protein
VSFMNRLLTNKLTTLSIPLAFVTARQTSSHEVSPHVAGSARISRRRRSRARVERYQYYIRAARKVLYLLYKDNSHLLLLPDDRAKSGSTWLCHSKNNRHCLGLHLRGYHSKQSTMHCLYPAYWPHCSPFWCNPQLKSSGVSIEDFREEMRHSRDLGVLKHTTET